MRVGTDVAPAPTLAEFAPRFMVNYVRANQLKPSTATSYESVLRVHLLPLFGFRTLDSITDEDIQGLKLRFRSPKTANNVVACLSRILKCAVRWRAIPAMPVEIDFLRYFPPVVDFYDVVQMARLIHGARRDPRILATVLLGGDAGLRSGELEALEWQDVLFERGLLVVQRSISDGVVTLPKGGRERWVPMTRRLVAALRALPRSPRHQRVLYRPSGEPVSEQTLRTWVARAQRLAGLPDKGAKHVLRHTFCSHLAMKGVPLLTIKELAGHVDVRTTQRYLHLAVGEKERAIRMLEGDSTVDSALAAAATAEQSTEADSTVEKMSPTGFEPVGGNRYATVATHDVARETEAGEASDEPPLKVAALAARFWAKVRRAPGRGCHEWTGAKNPNGYGQLKVSGRVIKAHHFALMLAGRSPLPGFEVSHTCHNRACVRVEHLKVCTHAENMRDGKLAGRCGPGRGEKNHAHKLTEAQVMDIRRRVAAGASQRSVARHYDLASSVVSYIVRGVIWAHLPTIPAGEVLQ